MTKQDMKDIADRVADERDSEVMELIRAYAAMPRTMESRQRFLNAIEDLIESEQTSHFQKREPEYYSGDSDEHEDGRVAG